MDTYFLEDLNKWEERIGDLGFFPGVLRCMWARKAISEGGDSFTAFRNARFYGWLKAE